mmetsp:Transcript_36283/g.117308  ORF Transcript_36283/g.117308 Transcript_36283/m.117308 type:complete len:211 (+) Transcript_36283:173-805(+)
MELPLEPPTRNTRGRANMASSDAAPMAPTAQGPPSPPPQVAEAAEVEAEPAELPAMFGGALRGNAMTWQPNTTSRSASMTRPCMEERRLAKSTAASRSRASAAVLASRSCANSILSSSRSSAARLALTASADARSRSSDNSRRNASSCARCTRTTSKVAASVDSRSLGSEAEVAMVGKPATRRTALAPAAPTTTPHVPPLPEPLWRRCPE